jgi:hypothetical protein
LTPKNAAGPACTRPESRHDGEAGRYAEKSFALEARHVDSILQAHWQSQ